MDLPHTADQYFTYESRLASFQTAQQLSKRRASNASTKGGPKSLKWPHKFLTGEELAKAGFFFYPLMSNPDNVSCFLCHKALDGWEDGDDPIAEHLKHNPDCGWAIVASIEKQDGELSEEYPLSTKMIEARKATFSNKWPHEDKKGWKCKVKQMVDAGWKYTPTPEYDDMATCTYCALGLDGWEKVDKPIEEHFKRSPECAFFTLISNHKQSPKRTKSKRDRASKASRLSTQSAFTVASEAPSIADLPAEEEDSILTTATNATSKRMTKARKAPAAKGRKTRAKKEEPVEVYEAPEPEDADFEDKVDIPEQTIGKKRKSEHQTVEPEIEAPAPKRRATRTRASTAVDEPVIGDSEISQPKGRGKKAPRALRKASAASVASLRGPVPNDQEIEKALEVDLERPLSDDEAQQTKATTKTKNPTHSMFGVEPMDIDEKEIEAELDAMEVDSKPLPKAKGAKAAGTRKVSAKQRAAAKKAVQAEEEAQRLAEQEASEQISAELEQSISMQQHSSPIIQPKKQRATSRQVPRPLPPRPTRGSVMSVMTNVDTDQKDDSGNETDASMASQSTVVRGGAARRGSTTKKVKGGKKGPNRNIEEIVHKAPAEEPSNQAKSKVLLHVEEDSITEERFYTPAPEALPAQEPAPKAVKAKATKGKGRALKATSVSPTQETAPEVPVHNYAPEPEPELELVQGAPRSPTLPLKDLTPPGSPQSSDAENQPPSSKPSAASKKVVSTPKSTTRRIPLADTTPMMSPSKRNVIAGLQTDQPWTPVDLDTIFIKSPSGNTTDLFGSAERRMKEGDLTSPEKRMTVEDWIHYNAEKTEEKLRNECERIVGTFESQGTRAMRALEGVECLE